MRINIRPETRMDYKNVFNVITQAFGRENEAVLVDNLRNTPRFVPELSLAAWYYEKLIGHILFYPIDIADGDKKTGSLALAPVSVLPEYQKQSVGSKLIKVGLSKAIHSGFSSVIVLGQPEYYPRFGFKPASTWKIKAPFEVPDNAFMALELLPGALKTITGTVQYPKDFSEV